MQPALVELDGVLFHALLAQVTISPICVLARSYVIAGFFSPSAGDARPHRDAGKSPPPVHTLNVPCFDSMPLSPSTSGGRP